MKNFVRLTIAAAVFSIWQSATVSAADTHYKFEKGNVIDFLYLKRRADSGAALQDYFKVAIPAATEIGYKPINSMVVAGKPSQGNMYPDIVAIGAWPGDFEDRSNALKSLLKAIPDLHSRRMDIWSMFNMSLYEVKENMEFILSSDKYYTLSAYWQQDDAMFAQFMRDTKQQAERSGAAVILELTGSRSPFGYMHEPEWVVLTEWENEAAFRTHQERVGPLDQMAVRHVTEFPVRAPKPRS